MAVAEHAASSSSEQGSDGERAREEVRSGYAQYIDEEDLDEAAAEEGSEEEETEESSQDDSESDEQDESHLRKELSQLPFATLVKARASLAKQSSKSKGKQRASDSEEESENQSDSEEDEFASERTQRVADIRAQMRERKAARGSTQELSEEMNVRKERRKLRESEASRRRESKHAPTEQSSKKPVSRKRVVVEQQASQLRDPRFSSLSAGPMPDANVFRGKYDFLNTQQASELSALRATHKALVKQEAAQAGPRAKAETALAVREERARVERALRRAEGLEAERQRRDREREVMARVRKENRERVEKGGKQFFLKDSAKKELFLKDKYERLATGSKKGPSSTSGPGDAESVSASSPALRKALERRRRKNAQKEKRAGGVPLGGGARGAAVGIPAWNGGGAGGQVVPKRLKQRGSGQDQGGQRQKSGHKRKFRQEGAAPERKRARRGKNGAEY